MGEHLPDLSADARRLATIALAEDGPVDLTTAVTVRGAPPGEAIIEARTATVVSGLRYAEEAARLADCGVTWSVREGDAVPPGEIGRLTGSLAAILRAERTVLNLLQRACGIATATRAYVEAMGGSGCRVLHTRKTAPGLRLLDVAAVVAGGGTIHRIDLAHTVMVKDNHWRALERDGRRLIDALREARSRGAVACQVEVETEAQLLEACEAGADRLLVDNQTPDVVRRWATTARSRQPGIMIEATGGITIDNVREYASAGVDFISIGALTHSVRAADISLNLL